MTVPRPRRAPILRGGTRHPARASRALACVSLKPKACRGSTSGNAITFRFCPDCGSTVFWESSDGSLVAVAVGAFADPAFPKPRFSVYESRAHAWSRVPAGDDVERWD